MTPLTVMSTGLGRDSMTMTTLAERGMLLVDGWPLALEDLDAVAFSDPGHEWPLTYAAIPRALREQMFAEFLDKGYDQACAFGTVRP